MKLAFFAITTLTKINTHLPLMLLLNDSKGETVVLETSAPVIDEFSEPVNNKCSR